MMYCDNASTVLMAANPMLHSRSKHFELDHHFIRDHIAQGHVRVNHISTHAQVADVLTKAVSSELFFKFYSKLRIADPQLLSLKGDERDKG